jgi:hypothetical protein
MATCIPARPAFRRAQAAGRPAQGYRRARGSSRFTTACSTSVLDRVSAHGDLFAPVLTERQAILAA